MRENLDCTTQQERADAGTGYAYTQLLRLAVAHQKQQLEIESRIFSM